MVVVLAEVVTVVVVLQVDMAVVQPEVVAVSMPEEVVVQPSTVVVEVMLVGTVQVAAVLLFLHTVCHDL
jgi:hypothetical protein